MSCKCQECGRQYKVDIMVPDELWENYIKPKTKQKGAGLLCGKCIMLKIEEMNKYDYWYLTKKEN